MCKALVPLFVSLLVMSTTFVAAQQPVTPIVQDDVDRLVRTINVSQMQWAAKHKLFGSLRDVEQGNSLSQHGEIVTYTGSDSATVANYEVRVLVSLDGKHYSTSITPTTGCGLAAFSSERGIIYHAAALGCEQTARSSEFAR